MRTNSMMRRGAGGKFAGLSKRALRVQAGIEARVTEATARQMRDIEEKLKKNSVYSLKGAAYTLTQYAKASIVRRAKSKGAAKWKASKPGQPPTTAGIPRKSLKAAIWYAVDKEKQDAVIGPRFGFVADVGRVHEHGGKRRGKRGTSTYPKRPFMAPALERTLPMIPAKFRSLLSE